MDPLDKAAQLAGMSASRGDLVSKKSVIKMDRGPSPEIFVPSWNLREAVKHCIMCEDHLIDELKRCPSCLSKHLLAIEAKVEEAISLDTGNTLPASASQLPERIREVDQAVQGYIRGDSSVTPRQIAQQLRSIRKEITSLAGRGAIEMNGASSSVELNPYDRQAIAPRPKRMDGGGDLVIVDMPGHRDISSPADVSLLGAMKLAGIKE